MATRRGAGAQARYDQKQQSLASVMAQPNASYGKPAGPAFSAMGGSVGVAKPFDISKPAIINKGSYVGTGGPATATSDMRMGGSVGVARPRTDMQSQPYKVGTPAQIQPNASYGTPFKMSTPEEIDAQNRERFAIEYGGGAPLDFKTWTKDKMFIDKIEGGLGAQGAYDDYVKNFAERAAAGYEGQQKWREDMRKKGLDMQRVKGSGLSTPTMPFDISKPAQIPQVASYGQPAKSLQQIHLAKSLQQIQQNYDTERARLRGNLGLPQEATQNYQNYKNYQDTRAAMRANLGLPSEAKPETQPGLIERGAEWLGSAAGALFPGISGVANQIYDAYQAQQQGRASAMTGQPQGNAQVQYPGAFVPSQILGGAPQPTDWSGVTAAGNAIDPGAFGGVPKPSIGMKTGPGGAITANIGGVGQVNLPGVAKIGTQAPSVEQQTALITAGYAAADEASNAALDAIDKIDNAARLRIEKTIRDSNLGIEDKLALIDEEYTRLTGQTNDDLANAMAQVQYAGNLARGRVGQEVEALRTQQEMGLAALDKRQAKDVETLRGELARRGIGASSQAIEGETGLMSDYMAQRGATIREGQAQRAALGQQAADIEQSITTQMGTLGRDQARSIGQIGAQYWSARKQIEAMAIDPMEKEQLLAEIDAQTASSIANVMGQKGDREIAKVQDIIGVQQQGFANQSQIDQFNAGIDQNNQAFALNVLQTGYGMSADQARLALDTIQAAQGVAQNRAQFAKDVQALMSGEKIDLANIGIQKGTALANIINNARETEYQGKITQRGQDIGQAKADAANAVRVQIQEMKNVGGTAADLESNPQQLQFADAIFGKYAQMDINDPATIYELMGEIYNRSPGTSVKAAQQRNAIVDYLNNQFGGYVIPPVGPRGSWEQNIRDLMNAPPEVQDAAWKESMGIPQS